MTKWLKIMSVSMKVQGQQGQAWGTKALCDLRRGTWPLWSWGHHLTSRDQLSGKVYALISKNELDWMVVTCDRQRQSRLQQAAGLSLAATTRASRLFFLFCGCHWTSQLTCCVLSPMPTLFWHTSPFLHKRWFCFWKRKVNTKSMLTRACFMETIAHLRVAFLKTEKEKKIMCQIWSQGCCASEHAWAFFPVRRENRYECLTLNKGHNGFSVLPAATSVWLRGQDAQCCVDRQWQELGRASISRETAEEQEEGKLCVRHMKWCQLRPHQDEPFES